MSALLLVLVEPKKEEERKNSKSLSQRSVTSGTRIHARARRGVTRRAHTHRHHHHPHHRRARDDAMRVRYNNSHGERERREREREGNPKMEMIIGYGRTILSLLLSLSFSLSDLSFPHKIKKTNFPHPPRLSITQKALGRRSLAPVAVVVRLLLGGEDSRTRGERARFRVHGKGRHILTLSES